VLHESIPVSYAIENNASVPFDVQYRVNDELVSFAANDDEMQSRVIDPVLYFSTYLGGSSLGGGTGVDIINDISVDPGNSMYVCGTTTCIDYPVKNWTLFNGNLLQGLTDAVVSKIWASGDLMFWSTYLGGTSTEEGINIAVDIQGGNLATIQASFVFASGHTTSSNFPTNVFPNLPYDQQDIFVTKFDATNGTFLTSRFYGGNLDDRVRDMAVSQSGKVYLVGQTTSSSLPIGISNPGFQPNPCVSSSGEAFAAALLEDFSVLYSTYLCGSFPDEAFGVDISVDTAIVVGHTASFDFAKTDVTPFPHSYRGSILMNANRNNGFCLALHPDGKSIVHGTFIGLNSPDRKSAQAVSVVERPFEKSIWVAGYASGEVPLEPTSFPGYDHTNTSVDGFVVHLTKDLSSLYQWTYLGSNLEDEIWDIDIDELGNAHLSGFTNSFTPSGFPPKYPLLHPPSDYDGSIYRGGLEAFAAELSNQLQVLHFFTYIGGGSSGPGNATSDVSYSNTYGANGRHFVVGQTSSIPVTQHFPNKFPNGINGYDGQDLDPISDGFLISSNCCIGTRGNIDNDSNESVDFSDLTVLVDFLFTSFDSPACYFESNLDGIDMVDISDLTELINHLFVSFQPLLSCPGEL
jgi:hypothetical protein